MARSSQLRATRWHDYHPELDNIKGRPAKVNDAHRVRQVMREVNPTTMATIPDSFESPESSTIASACYDGATGVLSVQFKRAKGKLDRYDFTVPPELWAEFVAAESKGQFFAARIRPLYPGVHIQR